MIKSTLADRMLELCGINVNDAQLLDNLKVERERGITVKSVSATMEYTYKGTVGFFDTANIFYHSIL